MLEEQGRGLKEHTKNLTKVYNMSQLSSCRQSYWKGKIPMYEMTFQTVESIINVHENKHILAWIFIGILSPLYNYYYYYYYKV